MPSQVVTFDPGPRLIAGEQLNQNFSFINGTVAGLTAHAGGGQTAAVPLTAATCEVSVCASSGDSVVLPPAQSPGQVVAVINNGAQTLNVFASPSTDRIVPNGTVTPNANGTAATIATGVICEFYCYKLGFWKQETSA
jgi:hypothetical protein